MVWLTANWFWVLIFIAFIGMHTFGHGGHGGGIRQRSKDQNERGESQSGVVNSRSSEHRH